ncbi:hypothetical protein N1851_012357 [Merluccius polli]|uniref:Uncharacterized protein n=1 Tax=Merluccius polli TaxID=89951 RepID=A0AA47MXF6_MERPO|nr:hypothetical protein N1851_012357 [Merluccius polli]
MTYFELKTANFAERKKNGANFRALVRFLEVKMHDFSAASVTPNAVVCGANFRQDNYLPGHMMEFRMGFQSQDWDFGDTASNEGTDAPNVTASAAVPVDPECEEEEAFSALTPQPFVLHCGSQ